MRPSPSSRGPTPRDRLTRLVTALEERLGPGKGLLSGLLYRLHPPGAPGARRPAPAGPVGDGDPHLRHPGGGGRRGRTLYHGPAHRPAAPPPGPAGRVPTDTQVLEGRRERSPALQAVEEELFALRPGEARSDWEGSPSLRRPPPTPRWSGLPPGSSAWSGRRATASGTSR